MTIFQAEKVDKKICQFYANGFCKFGFRCRLKHVQTEKVQVIKLLMTKKADPFRNLTMMYVSVLKTD